MLKGNRKWLIGLAVAAAVADTLAGLGVIPGALATVLDVLQGALLPDLVLAT